MRDREPKDLRDAVSAYFDRADRSGRRAAARATEVWAHAVGAEIAARTRATAVRDGELLVETDSAVWATELQAMSGRLVRAVNAAAGEELVRRVRVSVSRGARGRPGEAAAAREEPPAGTPRVAVGPLGEADRTAVERATAGIEDEELRAAAARAMAADIAWKRAAADPAEGARKDVPRGSGGSG